MNQNLIADNIAAVPLLFSHFPYSLYAFGLHFMCIFKF